MITLNQKTESNRRKRVKNRSLAISPETPTTANAAVATSLLQLHNVEFNQLSMPLID